MIKAMVVDDEALILEKIVYLLRNSSVTFESIIEAGNGQEALRLIADGNIPDLILTDIRMPIINGLELIEKVRAGYPNIRFVVISGYAEFEYAVKAMQFGVTSYVLKPVKAHELIKVVEQLKNDIVATRKELETMKLSEAAITENKRIVFENMLYDWLTNRQSDIELRASLERVCGIFNYDVYFVSAIMLQSNQEVSKHEIIDEMRASMTCSTDGWWIMEHPFGTPTIYLIFAGRSGRELAQTATWQTERIHKRLQDAFGMVATVGMGDVGDLRAAYRSSNAALKKRFAFGIGGSYSCDKAYANNGGASQSFVFKVKLVEQRLENRSGVKAKALLLEFANEAFVEHVVAYLEETSIDYLFNEYVNMVIRYCLKNNIDFLEKIEQEVYSGKVLDGLDDNHAVLRLITAMIDRIFDELDEWGAGNVRNASVQLSVIDSIIRYIDRNVHEEVTLQMVAAKFTVNPSYLSRVFKAATGQGFVKYVTGRKIDKAKALLEDGVMDIADIAHGLGFSDQQYFNRVYKKTTGLTPNESRTKSKKSPRNT
ncbi:response regulator transcription factor [Cohnella soli]|uniref:Response regulator n=1 Tax=Cohnella soli TaxID=425005 RepID=A0ABW0HW70_9BACL